MIGYMKNIFIKTRNEIIGFLYRKILKKIFFRIDAEKIHDKAVWTGEILGNNALLKRATSFFFNFSNPALRQNIRGITFENPIGLAAGFDKNAKMIKIMPSVGFGFTEVGSITAEPCSGNPKPRLWRLPKSRGLVVNYGLNNDGAEFISKKLSKDCHIWEIPVGINIAKTNSTETDEIEKGVEDYLKGIYLFFGIGDYLTINISCPNTDGGQPFIEPRALELLLQEVGKMNIKKPIFLKMPAHLLSEAVDEIIGLSEKYHISGFICSNLSKNRNNPKIIQEEINRVPIDKGGISGKPAEETANNLISYIYQKTRGEKIIIGCGGIFNADDAYKKIRLGASLLQLMTGMIFEGPQAISQINLGLCHLLKKDGFRNVSEAIGVDKIGNNW